MSITHSIGIDPGTHCGWAVLNEARNVVASGVWDLRPRRHEGGGMRFVRARKHLDELLSTFPSAIVGYEEVRRHMGVDASHVYGGIVACIGQACEAQAVPYTGIPVGTVKKRATGKGNADKEAMIESAANQFRIAIEDDNHADALWIAVCASESK